MKEIKKGKITMTIIIGIVCFILAFVMFMQFKVVNETDITSLTTKREGELREELETWKGKYEDTANQLEQAKTNLEETNVEGPGIIINLSDNSSNVMAEDLIKLMNELKAAEAEAISVNGQRITNLTEFADVDSYIVVNGTRLSSPYTIQVIGNQKYLESGITAKGGFSDDMTSKGKSISITEDNNIKILKYDSDFNINKKVTIE